MKYIVGSIPRSGSGYLCSLLAQTGRAGMVPFEQGQGWEYLLPHRLPRLGAQPSDSFRELLERAFDFGTTGNGVQGFKVVWDHFGPPCVRQLRRRNPESDALRTLLANEVRWVYLERRDHLAQAISWARATQSGRWNALLKRRAHADQYNYLLIRYKLWSIQSQRRAWRRLFETLGVRPLELVYEEFTAAPLETLARIGDHLGIPGPLSLPSAETRFKKQRDATNERWRERFLQHDARWSSRIAGALKTPFLRSSWSALERALKGD